MSFEGDLGQISEWAALRPLAIRGLTSTGCENRREVGAEALEHGFHAGFTGQVMAFLGVGDHVIRSFLSLDPNDGYNGIGPAPVKTGNRGPPAYDPGSGRS